MYITNEHPTELYYRRNGLLLKEAENAHLARQLRAARRMGAPEKGSDRRMAGLRRAIALWGRTSVPFFRA
jgi:hypothetical protein